MTEKTSKSEENSIFIGGKPFMNYVTGVIIQFGKGAEEVTVKARGNLYPKASTSQKSHEENSSKTKTSQ